MLTPAEEQGLSGLALASRVYHALYGLGEAQIAHLIQQLHEGARDRHMVYLHDGAVETIRMLPCPITILPDQLAYVKHVTLAIQAALKRLPEIYLHDEDVREILRLPEAEEAWLHECWGESQRRHNPVFGRLDALVDFTSPIWKDSWPSMPRSPIRSAGGAAAGQPPVRRYCRDELLQSLRNLHDCSDI